jgi:hypothetical protein
MLHNYNAVLVRLLADSNQTLGALTVYDHASRVFDCYTLELPWLNNAPLTSCIPAGTYYVDARLSGKYGRHWHVKALNHGEVYGRSMILIHNGNYHRDTQGCILIGRDIVDLDNDGHKDVTSSKLTMDALNNAIASTSFYMTIVDLTR